MMVKCIIQHKMKILVNIIENGDRNTMGDVIILRKKKPTEPDTRTPEEIQASVAAANDFEILRQRNKANDDKIAKERLQANKSVLRSYRIKN